MVRGVCTACVQRSGCSSTEKQALAVARELLSPRDAYISQSDLHVRIAPFKGKQLGSCRASALLLVVLRLRGACPPRDAWTS